MKKILLDTGVLRPNRICQVCRLSLNAGDTFVIIAKGRLKRHADIQCYHADCYEKEGRKNQL